MNQNESKIVHFIDHYADKSDKLVINANRVETCNLCLSLFNDAISNTSFI